MKTVLITGAANGIGLAISRSLYSLGWRVLMVDRSFSDCQAAADKISTCTGGEIHAFGCDLSDLSRLDHLSEIISAFLAKSCNSQLDVLIANAGVWARHNKQTTFNIDPHLLLHCLSPLRLFENLKVHIRAAGGRVIFTGCSSHFFIRHANADDLFAKPKSSLQSYALSKLAANWLCLALKEEHDDISFYVADPGIVFTDLTFQSTSGLKRFLLRLFCRFGISAAKASGTAVCLCQSAMPLKGWYFKDRKPLPDVCFNADLPTARRFLQLCREKLNA